MNIQRFCRRAWCNECRELRLQPFLRRLDGIPEDQASRGEPQEAMVRPDEVQLESVLREADPVRDRCAVRLQVEQSDGNARTRPGDVGPTSPHKIQAQGTP